MTSTCPVLLHWEFPVAGCLEVRGHVIGMSVDDLADAISALVILKRQCERIARRQRAELHCAADVPFDEKRSPTKEPHA